MNNDKFQEYSKVNFEVEQYIFQAKAILDYICEDFLTNNAFTANDEMINNVLWTASTMLENALEANTKRQKLVGEFIRGDKK
ncbi:MAG: hypothetical protein SOX56_07685 [[Pasteurella] mairii]|uniref:Uncharacterized protein n=1 Tax=[Pasteurella] mairii TaxID=757 RepID=A0A379B3H9_9PAST|nr:hypothetical protein [[Pasteurella] mairii]SUB32808.1 Uncharacterised protein [[Pasteurella] mairii]